MNHDNTRPDPDTLLRHLRDNQHGQLTIFLGYAAGVGKTYAMLETAQQRQEQGLDVVAAYIEPHKRPETEALIEGLETIPRRRIEYRGAVLEEMDLDAVLARRPQIALVDELAHTNAPTSRHPKRYQDVEELLEAGIDVYTTLNIQHIESLNDVVAQITGIVVRETLPDRLLDLADHIVLVDLPPIELIQRLKVGKVYTGEQAAHAIEKFFREGNLTALREMALRRTAKRVDEQMTAYMQTRSIPGPWAAGERLAVCVSPSPLSQKLIRTTCRLARELNAEWYAIYVETPRHTTFNTSTQAQIRFNLKLAEELGAHVVTITSDRVSDALVNYARSHNITQIVVGKPLQSRWLELLRGSVVDELVRKSGSIDVYVISSSDHKDTPVKFELFRPHFSWVHYLWATIVVSLTTLVGLGLYAFISPTNLVMLYLLAVVIAAVRFGRGSAMVAAMLSVVAFDVFFVPPRFTFAVSDAEYLITFVGLFMVGGVIANLAARLHEHAQAVQRQEADTSALYGLSRDISATVELEAILQAALQHINLSFGCEVGIFMPQDAQLRLVKVTQGFPNDSNEMAVALWAFSHLQKAGCGTDTLPAAQVQYLPLKTAQNPVGVLGVYFLGGTPPPLERVYLLEAFANQTALGIEAVNLAESAKQAELLRETEKLQSALLNSISHDLRTPLVTITGALSSLHDQFDLYDEATRIELLEGAWEEAERLNRLVSNLLEMTRLEAHAMTLHQVPCDVQEIIGVALNRLQTSLAHRQVSVTIPPDLPPIEADFVLIVQVLVNLLDNAVKYSPDATPIEIKVSHQQAMVALHVADCGIGITPQHLDKIFDKFYRANPNDTGGIGLGLSICQGIVEAHGGHIQASNRVGGGAIFTLTLPIVTEAKP